MVKDTRERVRYAFVCNVAAQQMIDIAVTTKYRTLKKAYIYIYIYICIYIYECDYSVVVFGQGEE